MINCKIIFTHVPKAKEYNLDQYSSMYEQFNTLNKLL